MGAVRNEGPLRVVIIACIDILHILTFLGAKMLEAGPHFEKGGWPEASSGLPVRAIRRPWPAPIPRHVHHDSS